MSYNKETGMYEGFIYRIYNDVNDKLYYGQTTTTIKNRWKQHKNSNPIKSKQAIHYAIKKYGKDKFHIEEIEKHSSYSENELFDILNNREMFYIALDDTVIPNGYNMTIGGKNVGNVKRTPVDVYDENGNLIMECKTMLEASIAFNYDSTSIMDCCRGVIVPRNGYIFRYHGDTFDKYRTTKLTHRDGVHVYQFEIPSGKIIGEFRSVEKASDITKVDKSNIKRSLYRNDFSAGGYYWSVRNEYDYIGVQTHYIPKPKLIPVCQYDIHGNYICEFASLRDAAVSIGKESLSSSIGMCCRGQRSFCGGYVWRYKGDPFDKYLVDIEISKNGDLISGTRCNPVDCYDIYGNFITTFNTTEKAALFCDRPDSNISLCCSGKNTTVNSLVFRKHGEPFNIYNIKISPKNDLRKIDEYTLDGKLIRTTCGISIFIEEGIVDKKEGFRIVSVCNGITKSINKRILRWHGDSFEYPGSIDTYPHPDYEQLFKHNPNATRDDAIDLLKNSLDNVGYYSQQAAQINIKEQD